MAGVAGKPGELLVSKLSCETGRQRYHVPASRHIRFDHPLQGNLLLQAFDVPDLDDDDAFDEFAEVIAEELDEVVQGNGDIDEDVPLVPLGTEEPVAAQAGAQVGQDVNPLGILIGAEDEILFQVGDELGSMDSASSPDDESGSTSDGSGGEESRLDREPAVPSVAVWRLNVTALSQIYNFYVAAYRDELHISRPRSCVTNRLPSVPDLLLKPAASLQGLHTLGAVDRTFGHQVNHLVIGRFGEEEILLLAYDDGDVIAYYTRHIEECLLARQRRPISQVKKPMPFFHENVGISAWGLAIHGKSRLIAVGSNGRVVHLFVFALTGGEPYQPVARSKTAGELFPKVVKDATGRLSNLHEVSDPPRGQQTMDDFIADIEGRVRQRDAHWQIVLETGREGHNIPNVSFGSDENGDADSVVAVDINANLWMMDIWSFSGAPHVRIPRIHQTRARDQMGWGVLVLPGSSFLPTNTFEELLGLKQGEARHASGRVIGEWVDISKGISNIRQNSLRHPWLRSARLQHFPFNVHDDLIQPESWFDYSASKPTTLGPKASTRLMDDLIDPSRTLSSRHVALRSSAGSTSDSSTSQKTDVQPVLKDSSSILRMYEMDIELRSFEEGGIGVVFEHAIRQTRPSPGVVQAMQLLTERLGYLLHVPELSLVVAASMCGRVVLITLTRPRARGTPLKRGFRIEAILPTEQDEDKQLRPLCPLLGVAVSPVPLGVSREPSRLATVRRYRLMIQYYDLRILSYELGRNITTNELMIF